MKRNSSVIPWLILSLTLVLSFSDQARASGGGHVSSLEESVDGYKVALTFKAGQAQAGHNQLTVRINDAQGQPVGNATVTVVARKYTGAEKEAGGHESNAADMGDMGKKSNHGPVNNEQKETGDHGGSGMNMGTTVKESNHDPAIPDQNGSPVKVELAGGHNSGEYEGEVETGDAGHWIIKVLFAVGQQEKSVAFTMDINRDVHNWSILYGILGINVAIILIAALTRKKSISGSVQEDLA